MFLLEGFNLVTTIFLVPKQNIYHSLNKKIKQNGNIKRKHKTITIH